MSRLFLFFIPYPSPILSVPITLKTKHPSWDSYTCFECETNTGVRILVIFKGRSMFNHIIRKISARAFHRCG